MAMKMRRKLRVTKMKIYLPDPKLAGMIPVPVAAVKSISIAVAGTPDLGMKGFSIM